MYCLRVFFSSYFCLDFPSSSVEFFAASSFRNRQMCKTSHIHNTLTLKHTHQIRCISLKIPLSSVWCRYKILLSIVSVICSNGYAWVYSILSIQSVQSVIRQHPILFFSFFQWNTNERSFCCWKEFVFFLVAHRILPSPIFFQNSFFCREKTFFMTKSVFFFVHGLMRNWKPLTWFSEYAAKSLHQPIWMGSPNFGCGKRTHHSQLVFMWNDFKCHSIVHPHDL